jgi:triosephosphate isomerase
MPKLIIANWKENPVTLKEALVLAEASDAPCVAIAPPFPFLGAVRAVVKEANLAAQDVFYEEKGAFTGAVSASQLASVGVTYIIVGHSERRRLGDTDEIVAKKLRAALAQGIIPILCVGESREEHKAGKAEGAIRKQLDVAFSLLTKPYTLIPIIAYEPVWAISTEPNAEADTPKNAVYMIQYIKTFMSHVALPMLLKYIYGGSVNAKNAESFLKEKEIEGALVGGASLKQEEIKKIIETAYRY